MVVNSWFVVLCVSLNQKILESHNDDLILDYVSGQKKPQKRLNSVITNFVGQSKCFRYNREDLDQCFPTFFGSRHPYLVLMVLAAPLAGVIGIKIKEL